MARYRLSPLSIRDTSNSPYAPLASATVTVYLAGGTTAATCYADTTTATPLANSQTTTNSAGYFEFYVDTKDYNSTQRFKIKISKTGYTDINYDYLPILQGIEKSEFSVHKNTTAQTITAATWTKLTWSTERFDADGVFTANAYTPLQPGKYFVTATAYLSALVAGKIFQIAIYLNGTVYQVGEYKYQGTTGDISASVSALVNMNGTTDYLEVYVYHNDTASRDVTGTVANTYFQGFKI